MKLRIALSWLMAMMLLFTSTALADYVTLRYKDSGSAVLKMQQALNELGYNTGGADGKFGAKTTDAVKKFQRDQGLTVDGLAGNKTLTKLYSLTGKGNTSSGGSSSGSSNSGNSSSTVGSGCFKNNYATLRYGHKGDRVTTLQTALNQLGYTCGKVDGHFGAATQRAVTAFQRAQKLTTDGLAGTKTLKRIEQLLAEESTGGSSGNNNSNTNNNNPNNNTGNNSGSTETSKPDNIVNGYLVPTRTLRRGMTGDDVKSVQSRLKELGYYTIAVDGNCGLGTINAVKAFQKKNGLTADGLAGTRTYQILFSDKAVAANTAAKPDNSGSKKSGNNSGSATTPDNSAPTEYVTLRRGATGADVTRLQKALAELEYKVEVTGEYDDQTIAAVRSFQSLNWLTIDGVAGKMTQQLLYEGEPVKYGTGTALNITPPKTSEIKLLHWQDYIKGKLNDGEQLIVYDPDTGISWRLRVLARGRHCDSEPVTQADTDAMYVAFGNKNTWSQKPVYVKLPWGEWTIAATHNVPHLSGVIKDNGFDGHLCVHFLRDMSEAERNDENYGVSNQKTIREHWLKIKGETIPYK